MNKKAFLNIDIKIYLKNAKKIRYMKNYFMKCMYSKFMLKYRKATVSMCV